MLRLFVILNAFRITKGVYVQGDEQEGQRVTQFTFKMQPSPSLKIRGPE